MSVRSLNPVARRRGAALLVASLVAIVAGFALALAPVLQSKVEVRWPQAPDDVRSTALLLANLTPHALDVEFDGAALEAAADGGGLLLSTVRTDRPAARAAGLVLETDGATLTVSLRQSAETVVIEPGSWHLRSSIEGMTLERDGEPVLSWQSEVPPEIDGLLTDVGELPTGAAFQATVQVLDDNNTVASPVKILILVVAALALIAVAVLLIRDDRARPLPRAARRRRDDGEGRWVRVAVAAVDVAVVGALVLWVFIGPMTADDGYYAVMARNNSDAGYVGMYYQIFNQTFVPFVWYWQFLDLWQTVSVSAVWLRIPSLIAAVGGWMLIRYYVRRHLEVAGAVRAGLLAVAGMVTVLWWCAFAIGVRPEAVAAVGAMAVLVLVVTSVRTGRAFPAFVAAAVGALSFAAHPTGVVAFGPLLVGIVPLWRALSGDGWRAGARRTLAVISGGAFALIAAFHDGALFEAINGQRRFAAVETPLDWTDELGRYGLLLENGPQGTYVKRAVVLVALVLVLWFLIAWAWDRRARTRLIGDAASLMGWTFAVGFVLIWITTSKWSHHFGAMAVIGAVFVAWMLVVLPARVLAELPSTGHRWLIASIFAASLLPPVLLALEGPQNWFSWNAHLSDWGQAPGVGPVLFAQPALWVGVVVVTVGVLLAVSRARREPARLPVLAAAVPVTCFALIGVYMFGTFGIAAVRGLDDFSTSAANVRDPLARDCLLEEAITTWDAAGGVVAPAVDTQAGTPGATPERLPDGTPTEPILATGSSVWTSLQDGVPSVGSHESGWFDVPALADGEQLVVAVAGHLARDASTKLSLERRDGSGEITTASLTDEVDRHGWRTLLLSPLVTEDTEEIRLVAQTSTELPGQWLAVSDPLVAPARSFAQVFPAGTPVSVHWLMSFWFACTTPPAITNGIVEPPAGATSWGDSAWDMNPWSPARGGVLAGASRLADIRTLAGDMDGFGAAWGRVQVFDYPVAEAAYELRTDRVLTPGWRSAFPEASQLVVAER